VGFDLTTHQGHFMGAGHDRPLLYTHAGRAWVRSDAVACQPGIPTRGARCAARVLGPGRGAAVEHAAPARTTDPIVSRTAVVIGSGPNGLVAGIRLAQAGHRVTVLEAAEEPGGAVRSEQLTLPGFVHDTFSSVYPAAAASPVFASMPLERHGLRWVHPAARYAHAVPDGTAVALYRDQDRTAASLDESHPGDGERWRTFVAPMLESFDAIRATMLAPFPPVRGALRLVRDMGPLGAAGFARLLPGSAAGLARRLFAGESSHAWLYGSAGHGDVPPIGPGSAIAVTYLNLLGHAVGWPSPQGGGQRPTDALVRYLRELGGELRTGALVDRIDSAHGRAAGVRLAGGERQRAEIVVADVMPHALTALAADALPSWYRPLLGRYRYGPATVKVDWALDGPIPWHAPEPAEAGTVHIAGTADELTAAIRESQRRLPEKPYLLLGQQTLADPTRAPAGKTTAWAYTHGPQSGIDWNTQLAPHVERIEAQVERFAPGFKPRILARHVMGPAELEHRNRNLIGGDSAEAATASHK
jgi:phytoene dehydrogenase-like protein